MAHPIELLGDVGPMEAHFDPFGDSVNLGARFVPNAPQAQKSVWMHLMVLLGDMGEVESSFPSVWR